MKRFLILIALLCPASLLAQDPAVGLPPYSSIQSHGFDATNRQNLNVFFAIPITHSPGRGLDLDMSFTYSSLIWKKNSTGNAWTPLGGMGWSPSFPAAVSRPRNNG